MHKLWPAGIALAMAAPLAALADTASDIALLRQEIAAIRAAYEARLRTLEQRLEAAESKAAESNAAAASRPAPVAAMPTPATAAAPSAAGANTFNPATSLILSGRYARTSRDPAAYAITGFLLPAGAEVGPGSRGFSLAESELGFAASIDPWLRGVANIALHSDDTLSVEEAYVQTTSLGNGLTLKAGRFFSGVGYLNARHAHTWNFVDNPLAYQAMLGTQYGDDGVQMTWLAPTDQFIELGLELGRGRSFPGGDNSRNGAGMLALTAHTGGDLGDSHSWRAGLSVLGAKANDQELLGLRAAGNAVTNAFSGRTRVWVADAVWKWAPNGNASATSFELQGEYLRSTRTGSMIYDLGNTDSTGSYRAVQSGWYLQGVYQFMPRWRVGLRTERLDAGNPDYGLEAGLLATGGFNPRKNTLMVDFNPSEFSRVRLQLARDNARQGGRDNQLFLQYQMSLGAHGAHRY
jgi:Putative beta-barrel porin-2, OmpL-like. bbp2